MMDLKNAKDHPMRVLLTEGEKHLYAASPEIMVGFIGAGGCLVTYEDEHNLTFAALDNDGLNALKEAYENYAAAPGQYNAQEVVDIVKDLFGLGD